MPLLQNIIVTAKKFWTDGQSVLSTILEERVNALSTSVPTATAESEILDNLASLYELQCTIGDICKNIKGLQQKCSILKEKTDKIEQQFYAKMKDSP